MVAHLLETGQKSLWSRLDSMVYCPVKGTASRVHGGEYIDVGFQGRTHA